MGTNYYRIPTVEEMEERKTCLEKRIKELSMSPSDIERNFRTIKSLTNDWDHMNPWDEFTNEASIHLGKRSSGWRFCWNFHKNKHYSNKEELFSFIRLGKVVDEYGDEQDVEEFIKMALEWGQPDGWVVNEGYRKKQRQNGHGSYFMDNEKNDDLIIDGLRVATYTDFC